ncbi:MAG: SAV_2336 N-terminal domain-related protein [Cyanobacteria bacterium P01_F01_bin.86]
MLGDVVAALEQMARRQNSQDLTHEDIADVLWLAMQHWQSGDAQITSQRDEMPESITDDAGDGVGPADQPTNTSPSDLPAMPEGRRQEPDMAGITTQAPQEASDKSDAKGDLGAQIAIGDATALRESMALLKALQPLIRLVPSATEQALDVPKTVKAIAETELCLLKFRPVPEPWLELAVVVDVTPSMVIWQRTVLSLRRVLAQSGVFRDVRLWSLEEINADQDADNGAAPLCIRSGFGGATASQPGRRPEELIDPTRRRLVLVISDCIHPRWDQQPVRDMLRVWATNGPMGLVQVLPEWMWGRTALGDGEAVVKGQLVAASPGQPSQSLQFVRRERWRRRQDLNVQDVKVPVMTLEPAVANRWSRLVSGSAVVAAPGLVFSAPQEAALEARSDVMLTLEPEERLSRFKEFSSLTARRLAGFLAACPEVSLPVVRMVQAALLPESQQVHVAEVLLGGLLRPVGEVSRYRNADEIQYEFEPGVQRLVRGTVAPKQMFRALSVWVEQRFGRELEDFAAYLQTDEGAQHRAFAGVIVDVMKRQGRPQTALIERLEALIPEPEVEVDEAGDDLEGVEETQGSEGGEIVPGGPLESFEFEYIDARLADAPPIELAESSGLGAEEAEQDGMVLAYLREVESPHKQWPLSDNVLRIGRGPEANDLVISEPWVSIRHAEILYRQRTNALSAPDANPFSYLLYDVSRYGTYYLDDTSTDWQQINRQEIQLKSGTQLRFGSPDEGRVFEFVVDQTPQGPALSEETFTVVTFTTESLQQQAQQTMEPLVDEPEDESQQQVLESFEFEAVTLVQRRRDKGGTSQWQEDREQRQGRRYVEQLPLKQSLEMVAIPKGKFMMGSPDNEPGRDDDESPQHEVKVPGFFMGRYPVTQAQWRAVVSLSKVARDLEPDPSSFKGDNKPVEKVSWLDAQEFCARLVQHTGREYRLPTEAEWEYACRAETTTPFHFGEMITTGVANYNGGAFEGGPERESRGKTLPVGELNVYNRFGLSDMHGNVYEWCEDHWHENYEGNLPTDGSAWVNESAKEDKERVYRGGSWDAAPRDCRSAYRVFVSPDSRYNGIGFRVSCSAP